MDECLDLDSIIAKEILEASVLAYYKAIDIVNREIQLEQTVDYLNFLIAKKGEIDDDTHLEYILENCPRIQARFVETGFWNIWAYNIFTPEQYQRNLNFWTEYPDEE